MGQHSHSQKQKLNAEDTEINAEVAEIRQKNISKQGCSLRPLHQPLWSLRYALDFRLANRVIRGAVLSHCPNCSKVLIACRLAGSREDIVAIAEALTQPKILELGCGRTKHPNAVGIDRIPLPGVDVVHDLNRCPYPFEDNTFDEVYAIHVIEHLDSILAVMEEIYRITKPGARVVVITPHHSDAISWQDPTHKWHLNSYSFSYFEPTYHTNYYTAARFVIKSREVELASIWKSLGIQYLVNLDNRLPAFRFIRKLWEQHLCYILRGKQITFTLETAKS